VKLGRTHLQDATPMLIGRPEDVVTAGITTAVVTVVAALSPHNACEQPLLRVVDTVVGIAVGLGAAWTTTRLTFGRVA
jgi:uncharacterized membrane protein YccC